MHCVTMKKKMKRIIKFSPHYSTGVIKPYYTCAHIHTHTHTHARLRRKVDITAAVVYNGYAPFKTP